VVRTEQNGWLRMAQRWNPVVAQRRLRAELRRLREEARRTQRDVATELDWSPSKVIRIEAGAVSISRTDLWALLQFYGVTDQARVNQLNELSRATREHAWWDEYRPYFTQNFITFIATEASATLIRQFQSLAIPGLLQTEDYARAIVRAFSEPEESERLVQARLSRQQLLSQEDRPQLFFILDEATLRRQVGGPDVMRRQLLRLREVDQLPGISIQVVTFDQGAHPGMRGSFGVYDLPADNGEDLVVYLEQMRRNELLQNDPEEISSYLETFYDLESIASPKDKLDEVLNRLLDE
jgi:transcriptional regulator with XRE-family HTH domain